MAKKRVSKDRHSQEFILFLREASQYIKHFRRQKKICPSKKWTKLKSLNKKTSAAFEKAIKNNKGDVFEANRDATYQTLRKKQLSFIANLNSTVTVGDLRHILELFNRPISWTTPLWWYIITGFILPPSVRVEVFREGDRVMVGVSPEANVDDYRQTYKTVELLQRSLRGRDLKNKRQKKKLKEYLNIAKDYKRYRNTKRRSQQIKDCATGKLTTVNNKKELKLALVDKYNPNAFGRKEQRQEEARQRQVYKRHKKYV